MQTVKYHVPDIECQGCANAITRSLSSLYGIISTDVQVDAKLVIVGYDEDHIQPARIEEQIRDAGYQPESM